MKISTILLAISLVVSTWAADTPEARAAFVASAISPNVLHAGDITATKRAGVYSVEVQYVLNAEGVAKISTQNFLYVAADDTYRLLDSVRANYTTPGPSEQQQVMAALAAVIGTFDDVNGWSPSTKSFVLGGKQIQLVSLTQNGQHVAYWGGAEVSGFGLVTKRVDDLR